MIGMNVERLDHVHVHVSDKKAAAAWFGEVLGLQVAAKFRTWANDPGGPLFLTTRNGENCLALFEGNVREDRTGDHTIAFRLGAADFIELLNRLDDLQLSASNGSKLSRNDVVDHELSWSLYFLDPDGNRFELTCYDYNKIASFLAAL